MFLYKQSSNNKKIRLSNFELFTYKGCEAQKQASFKFDSRNSEQSQIYDAQLCTIQFLNLNIQVQKCVHFTDRIE